MKHIKKLLILLLVLLANSLFSGKTYAATLLNVSDTITTSRPSAATPLSANAASGATSLSVFNNGSRFLASDSARIIRTSTGNDVTTAFTIASQASILTSVYVTGSGIGAAAQGGTDVLVAPMTAMHKVSFKSPNAIPSGGKILITFPGGANNTASPSATTFAFNGLTSANAASNISYRLDGSATCTFTVAAPAITCAPSTSIAANTTITFLIGCADASSNATSCTTQSPRFLNPTKSAAAGTADTWVLSVKVQDSGNVDLDQGKAVIGTIDSVLVVAQVDPTMTFTIAGVANGAAVNTSNTTGCAQAETTNTGIDASAAEVNLGVVNVMPAVNTKLGSITAQRINITTNATNGYTLTATSSGHLINPENGFWFNDWTSDQSFPPSAHGFGIHPCGADALTGFNESGGAHTVQCFTQPFGSTAEECQYAWPNSSTPLSLASRPTGPVTGASGAGITSIAYAAGTDANVPAGTYRTTITYVATPTF